MDNMDNLIKKIQYVLDLFDKSNKIQNIKNVSKNDKIKVIKNLKPCIWNMDTSILTIIEKFLEKIKDVFKYSLDFKEKKIIVKLNENKIKKRYSFFLDEKNITPSNMKDVAKTTKNQYIRVLVFFNLIGAKDLEKSLLQDYYEFIPIIDILNFYYTNNLDKWLSLDKIIEFVRKSLFLENNDHKRLAYSFLLCFIYLLDSQKQIFPKLESLKYINFIKNKKIDGEYSNNLSSIEKIEKISKETYGKLVEKTREEILKIYSSNDDYKILDTFFDLLIYESSNSKEKNYIIDLYHNEKIDYSLLDDVLEKIDIDKKIFNARSKLRQNILNIRNSNNDLHYSDIEPVDKNIFFMHDCIDQQEAAHILSVKNIRLSNKNIEDKLKDLEDPNNGILMDYVYHDAFDRGWLILDFNGYFNPTKEWDERYFDFKTNKYVKYPLMKIKDKVFNKEMLKFIENISKK